MLYVSHENKEKNENDLNQDIQNLLFRKNELVINLKKGKTETTLFGTTKRLKTEVFCITTKELILLKPINSWKYS